MKVVRKWFVAPVIFAAVFACAVSAQTTSGSKNKPSIKAPKLAGARHPKIAPGQECSDCHKQQYHQWEAGPHGVNQVKCLVCHGSVEEGFIPKPTANRCSGCHAQFVEQLRSEAFMKHKTCFTCHPPHLLKPHMSAASGGE